MSDYSNANTTQGDVLQLVSFIIDNEEFGIDILKVQEIIRPVEFTRVPNSPDFVEGVINLRGRIVPVIDLRKRFGLSIKEQDKNTRIVVVELEEKVVGFILDAVREVIRVDKSIIEPAPDLAMGVDSQYIRGVAKLEDRLLILLDLEQVLEEEILEIDEMAELAA
ncbi:MAG: chemotaxis protein CheW [Bacteroidota bacterium]